MRRLPLAVSLAMISAVAWAAPAPGVSSDLEDAVAERRVQLGTPADKATKKVGKALDKATKILGGRRVGKSRADEIKAMSKAVKQLEKKAPDEAALLDAADAATGTYRGGIVDDISALGAVVDAGVLRGRKGKSAAKALKRVAKAVDRADGATVRWRALKDLASASKALRVLDALDVTSGDDFAWVLNSVTVAPGGTGVDLDGDGEPDNGLGAAQSTLQTFGVELPVDESLAAAIEDGTLLLVLQMWLVNDFGSDPFAWAGTLSPVDDDADPTDNLSGAEIFTAAPGTADDDGRALARTAVSLVDGAYEVAVEQDLSIPLGETPVEVSGLVRVQATADSLSNDGLLGLVVPGVAVRGFLEASPEVPAQFVGLALGILLDVDTDGDGTDDAMSVAFQFTSVPCRVRPAPVE